MKEFEPTHAAKHICNSHMPTLKPKIAKELVCLPTLFCRPGKQNLASAKIENIMTVNKAQQVTSCIVHLADSANIESVTSNKLCNGLTGSCFESPNDTIHVTVIAQCKKPTAQTAHLVFSDTQSQR